MPLRIINVLLFLLCVTSFAWAMRKFFSQPAGFTLGMRVIAGLGAIFTVWHLIALLRSAPVSMIQALCGTALYAVAFALFWWAIRSHGRKPLSAAFSPDQPTHLVQHGPYRFLRHPFYSSYLLTWTAGVVASGNPWLLVSLIVMLVVYIKAAATEEAKFAGSELAEHYRMYRDRTGLFLPSPRKTLFRRRTTARSGQGLAR
jgi:protein-S-isoprenylcysteine O-methyltransferase Ste14